MHLVDASASCLHVHSRFELSERAHALTVENKKKIELSAENKKKIELSERAHALTVAKTGRKAQKGEQKGELALYGYLSKLWRKV